MGALVGLFAALALPMAACSSNEAEDPTVTVVAPIPLWQMMTAAEGQEFQRLVEVVGLRTVVERNDGSLTVFLPLEDAFAVIPDSLRQRLETPAYRPILTLLVEHHIAVGALTPADMVPGRSVKTIGNTTLSFGVKRADEDEVVDDTAAIRNQGFLVEKGELVTIESLLIPRLSDVLENYPSDTDTFRTFAQIVAQAGVDGDSGDQFQIFAPMDAAFAKMPAADLQALVSDSGRARAFVDAHRFRVPGEFADLPDAVPTAGGARADLQRSPAGSTVIVGGRTARVTLTDLPTHSGYMHIVDAVLAP